MDGIKSKDECSGDKLTMERKYQSHVLYDDLYTQQKSGGKRIYVMLMNSLKGSDYFEGRVGYWDVTFARRISGVQYESIRLLERVS